MPKILTHGLGLVSILAAGAYLCSGPVTPAIFMTSYFVFAVLARRSKDATDYAALMITSVLCALPGMAITLAVKFSFGASPSFGTRMILLFMAAIAVTLLKGRGRAFKLSAGQEAAALSFIFGLMLGGISAATGWAGAPADIVSQTYGMILSAATLMLATSYFARVPSAGAAFTANAPHSPPATPTLAAEAPDAATQPNYVPPAPAPAKKIDISLLKETILFALPFAISQTGMNLFYIVDLIFVGKLTASDMAGAGLASSVIITLILFGYGCLVGGDTIASQAIGAGDQKTAAESTFNALLLSLIVGCLLAGALSFSRQVFEMFGVQKDIIEPAVTYLNIARWALVPSLLFSTAKQYLQIINRPKFLLITVFGANALNAVLGYGLTLGNFGMPRLGLQGSAYAALGANVFMATAGLLFVLKLLPELGVPIGSLRFRPAIFKALLKYGMPAGVQLLAECWIVSFMAIIVGQMSATYLAGHSIATNVMTTAWSVPFGISIAAVVQTGNAIGAGNLEQSIRVAVHSLLTTVCWWFVAFGVALVLAPQIVGIYTTDPAVLDIGKKLLIAAIAVHLLDSLNLVITAVLRGKAVTAFPLYVNIAAYCVISPLLIWYLPKIESLGIYGVWIGFGAGLLFINVTLMTYWARTKRTGQSIVASLKTEATGPAGDAAGEAENQKAA